MIKLALTRKRGEEILRLKEKWCYAHFSLGDRWDPPVLVEARGSTPEERAGPRLDPAGPPAKAGTVGRGHS